MPDSLVQEVAILPPLQGLQEGLDPALPDGIYAPTFASDMANIRVAGGKWQTRRGQALFLAVPGSGDIRLLAAHYESDGTRIRLAARGDSNAAVLYDYVQGTDSSFNATSGGTGLGGSTYHKFQGVPLNDAFYFTDRAGPLRKYQETPASGNQVRSVALPTRPSAAPGVKARTYDFLEVWAGAAPFGWTEADDTAFALEDGTSTLESPLGGITALLDTKTSPKNQPISDNVSAESIPSNTIAMWVYNTDLPSKVLFQYGLVLATDFQASMDMPAKNQWLPLFINVGALARLNFKRFAVFENADAADIYLSRIALPGYLQGLYRWVYTHYDPTTGRESEPSDVSNSGTPLDLSAIGTTGQAATAAAFQKSAALTFTSDSGSDSSTTQIRIYRNGGVPALTVDGLGRSVWYRVGTVTDFSTTVSGAHSAGATALTVASGTGIANGDWLVIEKGTVSKEEYVRVTAGGGTTSLTISRGLEYAHSNGVAVQVAFVDNVPNDQVDVSGAIDLERDDPPTGCLFVQRSPDGRLWCFGPGLSVRVSNRATPERPTDYEVFPQNIDPLTRQNPNQGWDFQIHGDPTDESIIWGGFYRGKAHVITQRYIYRIHAASQLDWGPMAVEQVAECGCIAGDTVCEVQGWLYWVAPGPRVVRWNGVNAPQDLSHQRVNERLADAHPDSWGDWHAVSHPTREGPYYRLYFCDEDEAAEEFDPTARAGGLFGLQADSLSGSDNSDVTSWANAITGGPCAAFATAPTDNGAAAPKLRTSVLYTINGKQVVQVADTQGMEFDSPAVSPAVSNTSVTYYWCGRYTTPMGSSSHGILLYCYDNGGGFPPVTQLYVDSTLGGGGDSVGFEWNADGEGSPNDEDAAAATSGVQVLVWVCDKSVPEVRIYRNLTLIATVTWTTDGCNLQDRIELFNVAGGTECLIGETLDFWGFLGADSDADRIEMTEYLMARAGLS